MHPGVCPDSLHPGTATAATSPPAARAVTVVGKPDVGKATSVLHLDLPPLDARRYVLPEKAKEEPSDAIASE